MLFEIDLPNNVRTMVKRGSEPDRPALNGIYVNTSRLLYEVADGFAMYQVPFIVETEGDTPGFRESVESFLIPASVIDELYYKLSRRAADKAKLRVEIECGKQSYSLAVVNVGEERRVVEFEPLREALFPDLGRIAEDAKAKPPVYEIILSAEVLSGIAEMASVAGVSNVRFEFRSEVSPVVVEYEPYRGELPGRASGVAMPIYTDVMDRKAKRRREEERVR